MTLVIDTNCLLASLPRRSATRWLYDALLADTFRFGITTEILEEYEEIIGRFYAPELGANVVKLLLERHNAILVTPFYK